MEEKRSILDYLAQVLLIFGFAMVMINLFCLAFGASAEEFSACLLYTSPSPRD